LNLSKNDKNHLTLGINVPIKVWTIVVHENMGFFTKIFS
jgi:hypothetical protein